jgi:hypothetical protein
MRLGCPAAPGPQRRRLVRTAPVLVVLSLLLAGCAPAPNASTSTAGSPIAEASPPAASPGVSTQPSEPVPSALASPVGPSAFTTPVPPAAGTPWTGISWRKLAPADPLAQVRSVLRWRGGFVAVGSVVASSQTSSTPVWVSADGAGWRQLDARVFGPATVVIGVVETDTGIVALTLQGGANQCDGQTAPLSCWALTPPLQAWTSPDGASWTAHPGPDIVAPPGCDGCGVDAPILRAGTPGLLVINHNGGTAWVGARAVFSRDGVTWEVLPADAFPAGFALGDVAGSGSGYVAVGASGPGHIAGVALSSSDGRHWLSHALPTPGLDPHTAPNANAIVVGPDGLIVTGSDGLAPGTELWWSSARGGPWSRLLRYPPLGVWTGEGEGSGLIANGNLLGDGERILAYRGGTKPTAWVSTDGRSWRTLTTSGSGPTNAGDWPVQTLILTPIGVFGTGDDGSSWFGQPVT